MAVPELCTGGRERWLALVAETTEHLSDAIMVDLICVEYRGNLQVSELCLPFFVCVEEGETVQREP